MNKISGIYAIRCLANNKVYVGSSKDIYFRFRRHVMFLRNQKHVNKHLQNAFNKYGRDNFVLNIIQECDKEDLIDRENFWIHETGCLDKNKGFNKRDGASGGTTMSGKDHYLYGKHLSEETKEKISKNRKGKTAGEKHPMTKLIRKDISDIRMLSLEGFSNKEIAERYHMSLSAIWRIVTNRTWSI